MIADTYVAMSILDELAKSSVVLLRNREIRDPRSGHYEGEGNDTIFLPRDMFWGESVSGPSSEPSLSDP